MVMGEAVEEEEYRIHVRALSVFLLAFSFYCTGVHVAFLMFTGRTCLAVVVV